MVGPKLINDTHEVKYRNISLKGHLKLEIFHRFGNLVFTKHIFHSLINKIIGKGHLKEIIPKHCITSFDNPGFIGDQTLRLCYFYTNNREIIWSTKT